MNGSRYLLDTNAIVALLRGHPRLLALLQPAEWVGISIISQIEFLAFAGLTEPDRAAFDAFVRRVEVVGLTADNHALIESVVALRQQQRLKLPDAIIAALWHPAKAENCSYV